MVFSNITGASYEIPTTARCAYAGNVLPANDIYGNSKLNHPSMHYDINVCDHYLRDKMPWIRAHYLAWEARCDINVGWSLTSRKREALVLLRHIRWLFLYVQNCSELMFTCQPWINLDHLPPLHGLTLIPAWISNHTPSKVWDGIIPS